MGNKRRAESSGGCLGKMIVILLAIMFFPVTITVFIFKSEMKIKGKLIATALLWGGVFIASLFAQKTIPEKPSTSPAVESESLSTLKFSNQTSNSYVVNTSTMIFHTSSCSYVSRIPEESIAYYNGLLDNLLEHNYKPCEHCHPEKKNQKQEEPIEYDYDTERIVREGHPILLDNKEDAEAFWSDDTADDAVIINDSDNREKEYPKAYLILNCGELSKESEKKQILSIRTMFYNCDDAELFRMKDGLEIVRSYLPIKELSDNYVLRESRYQNIWEEDWTSDGTRKPNFQYDYFTNYELASNEVSDLPQWISIHLYLDGWGLVQEAAITTKHYQNDDYKAEEWEYDFITDNRDYQFGALNYDIELNIQYPRPSGTPALRKGSKGGEVGWLQSALNKAMYAGLTVNSEFDADTENAVREFQSRCDLAADGTVGPQTIQLIIEIASGKRKMPEIIVTTEPPKIVVTPPETEKRTPVYTQPAKQEVSQHFILNVNSGVFHYEGCSQERKMKEENKQSIYGTVSELIAQGYKPCGTCHPK